MKRRFVTEVIIDLEETAKMLHEFARSDNVRAEAGIHYALQLYELHVESLKEQGHAEFASHYQDRLEEMMEKEPKIAHVRKAYQ